MNLTDKEIIQSLSEKSHNGTKLATWMRKNQGVKERVEVIFNNKFPELKHVNHKIKIYYLINDIETPLLCVCGKHRKYIGFKTGFQKACGNSECVKKQRNSTFLAKYGTPNALSKGSRFRETAKETMIKRYGVDNPRKNKDIAKRIQDTTKKRHGVEWGVKTKSAVKGRNLYNEVLKEKSLRNKELQKIAKIDLDWQLTNLDELEVFEKIVHFSKMDQQKISQPKVLKVRYPDIWNEVNKTIPEDIKWQEKLYCYVNEITKPSCKVCGKDVKFNTWAKGYREYCSSKCQANSKKVNEKRDRTNQDTYGGHPMKNATIKNKVIKGLKINHLNYLKKIDQDFVEVIGNDEYKVDQFCKKCDQQTQVRYDFFHYRLKLNLTPCVSCLPKRNNQSSLEIQFSQFISQIYHGKIENNNRKLISPKELDVYLPDMNLAFEFNGVYWHSEKFEITNSLNQTKFLKCFEKKVNLIHVWEDDWIYKSKIVESRIKNLIGDDSIVSIGARKCEIKEITPSVSREFLIENHIQGFVGAQHHYGLFHQDQLLMVMTFGKERVATGRTSKEGRYELLRLSTKLGYRIQGGASKIFKFFIRNIKPYSVISYHDLDWGVSRVYQNLGFEFVKLTTPNYFYVIDGKRKHRYNFTKHKLVEQGFDKDKTEKQIMDERGIMRVYNTGNEVWQWNS